MKVDVSHLIERCRRYRLHGDDPATGIDCWWIYRELARMRFNDLAPHELPVSEEEIQAAIELGGPGDRWVQVGETAAAATRIADLVRGRRRDGAQFVLGVVDEQAHQSITALPGIGACIRNTRDFDGIVAVYRRRPCSS